MLQGKCKNKHGVSQNCPLPPDVSLAPRLVKHEGEFAEEQVIL